MISTFTDKQLPPDQAALWLKAQQSVGTKNYKYSISFLKPLVKKAPGFLEGRKVLRACEVKATPDAGRRSSLFGGMRLTTTRKNPEQVIVNIEDDLEKDP